MKTLFSSVEETCSVQVRVELYCVQRTSTGFVLVIAISFYRLEMSLPYSSLLYSTQEPLLYSYLPIGNADCPAGPAGVGQIDPAPY